jgi:pyruvate dehydrogenase E2 component (dihydrolipoamide acetyltransferase)
MAEIIRMPRMSDTMEEGVIVGWQKKVGDKVEPGDLLAEVETDKATMELESFYDGYLLYIGVESGTVPVDGIIAVIGEKDEDYKAALSSASKDDSSSNKADDSQSISSTSTPENAVVQAEESVDKASDERVKASPLAKSMAKEAGIDLTEIKGSGDAGRIVKKDVEAALEQKPQVGNIEAEAVSPQKAASSHIHFGMDDDFEEVNLSQMRKTIARRLGESKFTAPHFYLNVEIDMESAMETRKMVNDMADVKISFNDMVIKAAALSLRQHPAINAAWLGDKIRYNKHVHIGVAVAVEDGLLVPVVKNADYKSLSQLNAEVKSIAGKARDKKLQPQEMQGNTFTISNLGMFDIESFTAIINPPDACILAVGSIIEKPVVKNGEIVVGHRMKVTLSCDHRVVDGATGAKFLQTFKQLLEEPIRMIV